ncbi:MAG: hypothetical protein QOG68_2140 [Solirubrobacteraceae bacterium]|nr:hypothetical protein [Solirubrobacteraceae bacterium]
MHAQRLAAQLLAGPPAADPVAVCERLLAVQAQDPRGARLAVRVRTRGLGASDVDRALTEDRSLIVTWLNRGTLHLVRSEDYPWLQALTTPQLAAGNARRLEQEGVTPAAAENGVKLIVKAIGADGPQTRAQIKARLDRAGVRTEGQALVHILFLASLRGLIVRGPVAGVDQAFVLVREWLGAPRPVDRDAALAELARRFLAGHGPADERDLAKWAGITLRDARAGLAAVAPAPDRTGAPELPPPLLLGAFDPLLHGWADRTPVVGERAGIVTSNGIFRPIALVAGRAAATWGLPGGRVELAPFARLPKAVAAALAAEAADVERFLAA